jgi:hypothetical protein
MGFKPSGRLVYSLREAARDFNVSKTTLTARYGGRKTHVQAAERRLRLPPAQERILVEWAKRCGARGLGLSSAALIEAASLIAGMQLGERWCALFLLRHKIDLKGRWAGGLEAPRAQCLNRMTVTHFFELLMAIIIEYGIVGHNIYNEDEKGIQMGMGQRTFVLVDRNQQTVKTIEDGNRELVTIIECVCADGTTLRPTAIFKGARRDLEWGRENPLNMRYVAIDLSQRNSC